MEEAARPSIELTTIRAGRGLYIGRRARASRGHSSLKNRAKYPFCAWQMNRERVLVQND